LRDYEAILAKLAIDHADLGVHDFEPPDGTTRLGEFIDERWSEAAPRTRKEGARRLDVVLQVGQAEFTLHGNPVVPIRSPRLRDVERELFSAEEVARIVAVQPELRDLCHAQAPLPDGPAQGRDRRDPVPRLRPRGLM
jgi:hypothetical protein